MALCADLTLISQNFGSRLFAGMLIQSPRTKSPQSPRSKSPKSPRGILKKPPEHPPAAPLPKAVERTPSLSETSNHSETSNLSECSSSSPRRRRRAIILDRPSAGSETESSDYELIDGIASAAAALKAAVEAEDDAANKVEEVLRAIEEKGVSPPSAGN